MEDAMGCYQKFNFLEKELSEKNPDNVVYKNSLAVSHQKLGNIYLAQKKMENAMKHYQKFNSLEKELSEKDPDNVEHKNGFAISYIKLASLCSAADAREYSIKAKEIWEMLVAKVPQNAEYKKNLEWVKNILKDLEES
jgi:tetratricopeptide (TPR) repeat protein